MQYDHATWIADVPHGEELAFPWLFPRGVNCLFADRSKRLSVLKYFYQRLYNVDACWRKNITYLMFACNYMDQQRLSGEIGVKCVYVRVITLIIDSLPMTSNSITIMTMLYVYEEYQRNWADILGNLLATVRCLGPPMLFVTLSADDNNWPELKMLLQNITYGEATRNSSGNEQMRKDPLLTSLHFERRWRPF